MDFIKGAMSGGTNNSNEGSNNQSSEQKSGGGGGGILGGLGEKFNSAAGGGKESEKNEDMLDKGPLHPFPHSYCQYRRCWHHRVVALVVVLG